MAETLSYENNTPTETQPDNLSQEEQDSLRVAEGLESGDNNPAPQENLLAGKYKTAEDLEKAYKELESKLGQKQDETKTDETPEQPKFSDNAQLITNASEEWTKAGGKLTDATKSKLAEMSSADLLNAYMEVQASAAPIQQIPEITTSDIASIKESVGGNKEYTQVINWAKSNLPEDVIKGYDQTIESGSLAAIKLAAAGLKAQYEAANGSEGKTYTGKPASNKGDVFRSQAELLRAMNDPRYDNDEAYRQDVMEKLDRSDINF